ncbi:MAG: DUF4157 domain-containing protein [Proteobacteria bacterium]|nr:DUF4157 domain-containing protein [Pseudomonadota bacterium]
MKAQNQLKQNISSFTPVSRSVLQRKCACGNQPTASGECAQCSKEKPDLLSASRAVGRATQSEGEIPSIVHETLRSSGQPLDSNTRLFMEPRFGHDFSRVQIHTGANAVESANAVNALAYTVGRDIVFASGQYAPNTKSGQRLLAHELTHVVQQTNSSTLPVSRISRPSDPHEHEADQIAERIMQHSPTVDDERTDQGLSPGNVANSLPLQRQEDDGGDGGGAQAESGASGGSSSQEGFEINTDELMVLPQWQFLESPERPALGSTATSELRPSLQRQFGARWCDNPSQMRKVTSGTFEGGKTLDDYFPDLVGRGAWGSNNTAGPFDNGSRAGSAVQLIGELPIPCDANGNLTVLGQSANIVRARANGRQMMEGGRALEGQTINDIQRSGRDSSRSPFRQTWVNSVSMADPISGIPYSTLASYEWEVNLTTSLTGGGGTVSTGWGVTVEARGGRVTRNEVR